MMPDPLVNPIAPLVTSDWADPSCFANTAPPVVSGPGSIFLPPGIGVKETLRGDIRMNSWDEHQIACTAHYYNGLGFFGGTGGGPLAPKFLRNYWAENFLRPGHVPYVKFVEFVAQGAFISSGYPQISIFDGFGYGSGDPGNGGGGGFALVIVDPTVFDSSKENPAGNDHGCFNYHPADQHVPGVIAAYNTIHNNADFTILANIYFPGDIWLSPGVRYTDWGRGGNYANGYLNDAIPGWSQVTPPPPWYTEKGSIAVFPNPIFDSMDESIWPAITKPNAFWPLEAGKTYVIYGIPYGARIDVASYGGLTGQFYSGFEDWPSFGNSPTDHQSLPDLYHTSPTAPSLNFGWPGVDPPEPPGGWPAYSGTDVSTLKHPGWAIGHDNTTPGEPFGYFGTPIPAGKHKNHYRTGQRLHLEAKGVDLSLGALIGIDKVITGRLDSPILTSDATSVHPTHIDIPINVDSPSRLVAFAMWGDGSIDGSRFFQINLFVDGHPTNDRGEFSQVLPFFISLSSFGPFNAAYTYNKFGFGGRFDPVPPADPLLTVGPHVLGLTANGPFLSFGSTLICAGAVFWAIGLVKDNPTVVDLKSSAICDAGGTFNPETPSNPSPGLITTSSFSGQ